jgi:hypothetical protein
LNYVRSAIYTKLEADASLLALLGSGTASLIGDREATSTTVPPLLVVSYNGGRTTAHIGYQTWAIYCETKQDPKRAAQILALVKKALNGQTLSVSGGGIACMECIYFADTPSDYDRLLRLDVEGQLYRVYVRDI